MTNEKEWWKDDKYFVVTDMNEHGEVTGEGPNIEAIVLEAERRGHERAMEEVKAASLGTVAVVVAPGEETEEWVDALAIPKSFFEK